ncbi:hypothetical protein ILUMI_08062 [Ignelater luminosus]|uniref:Uncharacterized protein n=1 Tax=Ignelater luminosus TaxID=2038154 RepID=A0A8K0DC42_IGNLU|nr:hypothetical protein ILUMI_08062 [Ignelater luminosus]
MEWPSERVAPGGIFQPAKVNYSPETRDFLKELINESKLTIQQRQKVNYSLRSGEPLPPLHNNNKKSGNSSRYPTVTVRPGTSKKRSQYTIIKSGAYEREKFVPQHPKVDREKAKKHLQDYMAFGKDVAPTPRRMRRTKPKKEELEPQENRFDQLLREIKEREEWYKHMVELGEGPKYKIIIDQQIQAKLREMERLKSERSNASTSRDKI